MSSRPRRFIFAVLTLATVAGAAWYFAASAGRKESSIPGGRLPEQPAKPVVGDMSAKTESDTTGETVKNAPPRPPLPTGDAALEAISDLTTTYDAASVPALALYLAHTDPEIRTAAREGLVQLGERAAIPYLEEAARHAAPEEAQALREAAEFLALPTWTERRAALKAQQAGP